MLFSFVDLYHLIAYLPSKKYKVCCAEESCGAINSIKQLSLWGSPQNNLQPSAKMLKSTL